MPEKLSTAITTEADRPVTRPTIEWQRYSTTSAGVVINLPETGKIIGTLRQHENSETRDIYVDMFEAVEAGRGSGKYLLGLLKDEGLKYRATTMSGHFTSELALGAFLSVVGNEHVTFRDHTTKAPLDISAELALQAPEHYIATGSIDTANPTQ